MSRVPCDQRRFDLRRQLSESSKQAYQAGAGAGIGFPVIVGGFGFLSLVWCVSGQDMQARPPQKKTKNATERRRAKEKILKEKDQRVLDGHYNTGSDLTREFAGHHGRRKSKGNG